MDKVIVVIKDKEEVALERFIFSVKNMIEVEAYNKDTRFLQLFLLCALTLTMNPVYKRLCRLQLLVNTFEVSSSN